MGFYSGNFSFNGVSNRDMGVILVKTEGDVLNECGLKYKEGTKVDISANNHFYYNENIEIEPITMQFTLVDEKDNPCAWTLDKRKDVIDWLVTKEFCPFVSEDDPYLIYYIKCIEYVKKFNHEEKGILEVVMQPESQYAYTPIIEHVFRVKGEEEFVINNISNVEDKYYPMINIIHLGENGGSFIMKNLSTNMEQFEVHDLKELEHVDIDHMLKNINSNMVDFKLKDSNRKWFYLKRGLNNIVAKGDCELKIVTQFPLKV